MRVQCPRCATQIEAAPGMPLVCPKCGFGGVAPGAPAMSTPASPVPPPGAPMMPAQMAPPGMMPGQLLAPAMGPIGKTRSPGLVILFSILTLGIYALVWYMRITREIDAFMGRPGQSHKKMKTGVVLGVITIALGVVAAIVFVGWMMTVFPEGGTAAEEDLPPGFIPVFVFFFVTILALIAVSITGLVFRAMALWQLWKLVEEADKRRIAQQPFNPTTALVMYLLGIFVPYIGPIFYFICQHMTQKGLNELWRAYGGRPA